MLHIYSLRTHVGRRVTAALWGRSTGNSNQQHPIHGKLPGGQTAVKAGMFSATMTMTLTYNP